MEPTEQGPSTPPTRRRRRRWLIVAIVLVLVSMVSWWFWPRGDARFVGKWIAAYRGEYAPNVEYLFRRDGTGTYHFATVDRKKTVHRDLLWWKTDSGLAVLMRNGTGRTAMLKDFASVFYVRVTSNPDPDQLTFLWDPANQELEFVFPEARPVRFQRFAE
jgi:hypothetical protein